MVVICSFGIKCRLAASTRAIASTVLVGRPAGVVQMANGLRNKLSQEGPEREREECKEEVI